MAWKISVSSSELKLVFKRKKECSIGISSSVFLFWWSKYTHCYFRRWTACVTILNFAATWAVIFLLWRLTKCVMQFCVSKQLYGCQYLRFLACLQTDVCSIHAVRQSALNIDWEKNPLPESRTCITACWMWQSANIPAWVGICLGQNLILLYWQLQPSLLHQNDVYSWYFPLLCLM